MGWWKGARNSVLNNNFETQNIVYQFCMERVLFLNGEHTDAIGFFWFSLHLFYL